MCTCCTEFCLNEKWFAWIDAISCRCNQSVLWKVLRTAIQTSINRLLYNKIAKCVYTYLHPPTRTHITHRRMNCSSQLHTDAHKHRHTLFRCWHAWEWWNFCSRWFFFSFRKLVRTKEDSSNDDTISFVDRWKCEHGINSIFWFYFLTLSALLCFCAYCTPNLSFFCYVLVSSLRFQFGLPYVS